MKKCDTLRALLGGKIPSPQVIVRVPALKTANACYQYCGQAACNYMTEQTRRIIEGIAFTLWRDFPDRTDRRLAIADAACSGLRTCPGHDAHAGGHRVDFNYFTYFRNWTQYLPPWANRKPSKEKGRAGYMADVEHIWAKPRTAEGLLINVFDVQRNFIFFHRALDVFPHGSVLVSDGLRAFIEDAAARLYPEEWAACSRRIVATGATYWNHHTHVHIDFGTKDRPDGFDVDWDLARAWIPCR